MAVSSVLWPERISRSLWVEADRAASAGARELSLASVRARPAMIADPVTFTRNLLLHDTWTVQEQILTALASNKRVAVKACHASGKTFTSAEAVLWWITRYPDGIAITTAPTWTQVERLLWGEIHKATAGSRIAYPELHKAELRIGPENYAIGLSTDQGVRFQGWHGRILIVIDEAPGVRADIYEAIEGIRAGGQVHVLALGNPTIASGPFYDAFTAQRSSWATITISAFDTPNLEGLTLEDLLALDDDGLDVARRPYLVSRRWVREKYYEWGVDHPLWQSRVLGQFPQQSDDALISLAWLDRANREAVEDPAGEVTAGIDVAGPGEDETVLVIRSGNHIEHMQSWKQPDPRGAVLDALARWKVRLTSVNVDSVGIGYYFALQLRDAGYPVQAINVGDSLRNKDRFANRKAELYQALRDRFAEDAITGLEDDRAIGQLAAIRFGFTPRGQMQIESKEALARRGVASPDRAEAIMLAFAPGVSRTLRRLANETPELSETATITQQRF